MENNTENKQVEESKVKLDEVVTVQNDSVAQSDDPEVEAYGLKTAIGIGLTCAALTTQSDAHLPLDKTLQRTGENIRRTTEDVYYKHVPKEVRKTAESASKAAGQAASGAAKFVGGLLGR